jgi:hypothetical protein
MHLPSCSDGSALCAVDHLTASFVCLSVQESRLLVNTSAELQCKDGGCAVQKAPGMITIPERLESNVIAKASPLTVCLSIGCPWTVLLSHQLTVCLSAVRAPLALN